MKDVMLILHFIGLTMGLGTSFAHAFLGVATSKMAPDETTKFRLHSLALGRMGHIGLALLLVSGLYLMTPFWGMLSSMPLLILKLVLVIVLAILISLLSMLAKKARSGDAEVSLKKIEQLGKMTMLLGLAIVFLAVYIFH